MNRDVVNRTVRTFLQSFVGTFSLFSIPYLNGLVTGVGESGDIALDFTFLGKIAVAALIAGFISLITFVQNALEDASGSGFLKPDE